MHVWFNSRHTNKSFKHINIVYMKNFARIMGNYSGDLTALYEKYVDMELYKNSKELSLKDYAMFTNKDANNAAFTIPDYSKTLVF